MTRILASLLVLLAYGGVATAQPVSDYRTTSCEGLTERLSDTLAAGRPVVVAMLAFDCWTQCNPDAPHVGAFARANDGRVRVWAAMFTLERPGKTPASCDTMPAWKRRHDWTNVHAFIDEPVIWAYEFGAHYIVIDPRGSVLAYRGDDFAEAAEVALSLANPVAASPRDDTLPTVLDLR